MKLNITVRIAIPVVVLLCPVSLSAQTNCVSCWTNFNPAIGAKSIVIGPNSLTKGANSIAIGYQDTCDGDNAVSIGVDLKASGTGAVALGTSNIATGNNSFVSGYNNYAEGAGSSVLGSENQSTGNSAIVLGSFDTAKGDHSVAIGVGANAIGNYSIAIGKNVSAVEDGSVVIGSGTESTKPLINNISNSLSIGFKSSQPTLFISPPSIPGGIGNIGIGTSSPQAALDVVGNMNLKGNISLKGNITVNNREIISSTGNFPTDTTRWILDSVSVDTSNMYYAELGNIGIGTKHPKAYFHVQGGTSNNPDSSFLINRNGNVAIGAISVNDTFKLSVKGVIRADELLVYEDWADFVFSPEYTLRPLDEVEHFIKDHQHLPDIPSAEQIRKNGLALAETQKLMMVKIEELTLYVLELKKQNDKLMEQITRLTAEKNCKQ
jgi:autotransporter adhesin